jgi:hypothetical protein
MKLLQITTAVGKFCSIISAPLIACIWIGSQFVDAEASIGNFKAFLLPGDLMLQADVGSLADMWSLSRLKFVATLHNDRECHCGSQSRSSSAWSFLWPGLGSEKLDPVIAADRVESDVPINAEIIELHGYLPLWMLFVGSTILTASFLARKARRPYTHRCSSCDYDVRSTFNSRCPECGQSIAKPQMNDAPVPQ